MSMQVTTRCVGTRIDTRPLAQRNPIALNPLTITAGERGHVVLFRFGVVVFFDVNAVEEAAFLKSLESFVHEPFAEAEIEETTIHVDPDKPERVEPDGTLTLRNSSPERLQIVAQVLAKSTLLAQYEQRIAAVFDQVEKLARDLSSHVSWPWRDRARYRELMREIGSTLVIQAAMVGRAEVGEKPELTWDNPELDHLYERLAVEYELRERDLALTRKLTVMSETAETYLELLRHGQTLRVEWLIVILIVAEILMALFHIGH